MALTDAFRVAEVLSSEGAAGLRKIQLQPLVPVRPALAGGTVDEIEHFPVWVERKYDGIRLMLHKSTDARGFVLAGAYTRTRGDWLELIAGLDATIKLLPCRSAIVDGELYGTLLDHDGVRPATVYEVHSALQGERAQPVNLKFAAFDLIYQDGRDLTPLPLQQRRTQLMQLLGPITTYPTPIPFTVAEGQLAASKEDTNRLYHHFRAQGYEGIITKDLSGPYLLSTRDPTWMKRKPEITLDLVLLGAVFAVTTKERAGMFGSYAIGARGEDGVFEDVGDVAGVDRVRDAEIQAEIMREGLITGRRIERPSSSGVRPGLELRPHIVVTVKFEGIAKDNVTGKLSLRDPKIAVIRSDKSAQEADKTKALEEIYLRARVG
jgi:DNA ligase-1